MKNKSQLTIAACIAALASCAPLSAQTMPRKSASLSPSPSASASSAASPSKPSVRPIPFHGMVFGVDQRAKTFTIAGKTTSRVFKLTDKTAVTKAGNLATMADIVARRRRSEANRSGMIVFARFVITSPK